jgi:hypothetical protein
MLENRRSTRRKMVRPVKVLIDRDTHLAHTIDITTGGARLGALRQELKVGTNITLQRGRKRGKFRVAWIKQFAPGEVQAGIEALQPNDEFWGVWLSVSAQQNKATCRPS